MEFLEKLGIDIKLLIAQIINFGVLLWLLNILLYKPLIKKLEERAKRIKEIEEGKKEIERKKEEMKKQEEEIIQKTKEKAKEILKEAEKISKEEREKILERTEKEVRQILKEAREKAELEAKKIKEREREEILNKAKEILRETLKDVFKKEIHQKYLREAIKELNLFDFKKIKEREIAKITVVSAFPLTKKEEKEISNLLFKKLGKSSFQEKIDLELIAGIRVYLDGYIIDQSLKGRIEKAI